MAATPRAPRKKAGPTASATPVRFDADLFLHTPGMSRHVVQFERGDNIFSQGEAADSVFYIRTGAVKLSVVSKRGREAVLAILGPGDFFGEGCLAGQPLRLSSATAVSAASVLTLEKGRMARLLRGRRAMSERFITHLLTRNMRVEEDLVDHLFNPSERRLARALLLLARYGAPDNPVRTMPKISQEVLAQMVGTTRSRVNFFMKKFERLGFIDYKDGLTIRGGLLTVVLHEPDAD
ncbi:MAG: Crp/Fnr family transcriptional regulator [Vicinamibacterales bacterium]